MALVRSSYEVVPAQDVLMFVEREATGTVVWLRGEHDASTVDELWEIMIRAIEIDSADIVIDLSGVTFIGSATIRVIARTFESLRRRSRSLIVRSPSRCAQRALDLYDLADPLDPRSTDAIVASGSYGVVARATP